ncbi:MAG TPA: formate C-acetyltransferase/glycerol dehydratase family glycyl radical enzyme [Candidatus Deferrimicrobium sp.]|nr:formate C-acetyltransferase/glycerol dehydratase family glycyl radical enzyme [Candidatus Deferrimicrobium sp.]
MVMDQVTLLKYQERTLQMKNKIILQPHEICMERAILFTESYKKTRGENPIMRFAKAMDHLLRNMTIKIWDDEFIVGNRCTKYVGTPLYPEVRVDSLELDCDLYNRRQFQHLFLSEEDNRILKDEIIPYWKNEEETVQARFMKNLPDDVKAIMNTLVFVVDTELTNGPGHFLPGHENILKFGINGLLQKAMTQLREYAGPGPENSSKRAFLQSVIIVYNAAKAFIQRFSNLAREKAEMEPNPERKKELREISKICENISENPPSSFKEALQLIFFNHLICGLEDGGFAISVGRLDQYLFPYYLKDKETEKITPEEVQFLIECFFLKLCTLWNYILNKGTIAGEGPPIAENLTIGGVDRTGNDATNELSYLILDAYTRLKTVQPTFSIRIHENTPEDFLIKVAETVKSGASVALFNDQVMIRGLQKRGFTLEDACEYAPIGCVEPQHPHKSFGSTNANQLNIVKILEMTLSNGRDICTGASYGPKNEKPITTYNDLWEVFLSKMRYYIKNMVSTMDALDNAFAELDPQPFLSATIDDCIERGLDITKGGAIYDFTGPQLIGLATVADSLAVIKKVVFEDQLLPLEELVAMLKKDYKGTFQERKAREWQQTFMNRVPKFGNDDDYVDRIAVEVAKAYCEEIAKYTNYRGGKYNPGIYSTSFHLAFGAFTGATADGRKMGLPLSNGLGPTHGMDLKGPTSLLNSIMKLPHDMMTNGNSFIMAIHPNSVIIDKFLPILRIFLGSEGGYHIQFNVCGKDTLIDAQSNPDNYRSLVVRIAGYSVYFTELSKGAQNEIIARTECSL